MNELIYIVDDEPDILQLVALHLEKAGFKTKKFTEARKFLEGLKDSLPDLVILDLMLPDLDGLEVCKMLKSRAKTVSVPLIMLTAKTSETDKVVGLELGADDYLTKPLSPRELTARVKAVLRRNSRQEDAAKQLKITDNILLDLARYEVLVHNKKVDLTPTEFKLLEILSGRPGIVFSRDKLLDLLWGNEKVVTDRTIDVHINNLREKLGAADLIVNVRKVGYKIHAQ
jgi:two-component system phosphate regulon response regulator PhoB/two-component system alkaline phosphatase synthesis response regulator PhoP